MTDSFICPETRLKYSDAVDNVGTSNYGGVFQNGSTLAGKLAVKFYTSLRTGPLEDEVTAVWLPRLMARRCLCVHWDLHVGTRSRHEFFRDTRLLRISAVDFFTSNFALISLLIIVMVSIRYKCLLPTASFRHVFSKPFINNDSVTQSAGNLFKIAAAYSGNRRISFRVLRNQICDEGCLNINLMPE